mmetsp:Transcript_15173/g.43705  ORF Transcript_15173/g.43705 Transcript_15173/m.43705 type:complete len:129 (-) Transcript_15173:53-439(-)
MLSRSLAIFLLLCCATVSGFLAPQTTTTTGSISRFPTKTCIQMSDKSNKSEEDRLRALGYSEEELRRSKKESDPPELNVRVDLVDDVDSFTLTAIGFGLIALNFFVFANMGDGGIAGLVATIINTVNQ